MTRFWDTVMVRDELDMLECRLTELEEFPVYKHIVAEANVDHQGHPKEFNYLRNMSRFAKWANKIIYVKVESLPDSSNPWEREEAQRDRILDHLTEADDEDLVLVADVDEIPSREVFNASPETGMTTEQRLAVFAVDWLASEPQRTGVVARVRHVREKGMSRVRRDREQYPVLPNAGWHLSWLGGPEAELMKMRSHCHTELDEKITHGVESRDFWERGKGFWGNNEQLIAVEVDSTWPKWIYERQCPNSWFRPR